jgi:nucleoside-diphosphate-sugar epimerase
LNVFITGASGYAGYYATLRLAQAGHRVTGIVRNPVQQRLDVLRTFEVELHAGDVSRPDTYRELLERSNVIIHTMQDKQQPMVTDRALLASLGALPALPGRRFIYTTGASMFGKVGVPVMDEHTEPNPDHPLAFRRTLEREALALTNLGVVVVRPGFIYGNDGYNCVFCDWFEMAEAGDAVFRGDRAKGWSWIHVADLAEAYVLVAEAGPEVDGEVFNLADEHQPRSLDLMRVCLAAAGHAGEVRFEPGVAGDNIGTWFDQNEFITSAKARSVLGWTPRHPSVLAGVPAAYAAWKVAQQMMPERAARRSRNPRKLEAYKVRPSGG